ncbi:MAG: hypothetical protein HQL51_07000 [Magnetococcales bacterium]|nr:hypothetical protein [Magnetococcales bacterium]
MSDEEKKSKSCWTGHRKDGSPYVWCEDGTQGEGGGGHHPDRGRPPRHTPPPSDDLCNDKPTPVQRFICRQLHYSQDLNQVLDKRYHLPPDLSNPPKYGWDEIDRNIERTLEDGVITWVERVSPKGEWDYKNHKDKKNESYPARERAGNVNYGATCIAAGFDPDTCLRAGGAVQIVMDMGFLNDGLPWDPRTANSCYGEPNDDCRDVLEGIRYGLAYLRRRKD